MHIHLKYRSSCSNLSIDDLYNNLSRSVDAVCITDHWKLAPKKYNPFYDIKMFYAYRYITRLSCVLCPLIFLRTKLSINCVYAEKNKDKFDYDFSIKFLDEINEACKSNIKSHRGALKSQMELFMLNYNRLKNVDFDKIEMKPNNWDVKFWYMSK